MFKLPIRRLQDLVLILTLLGSFFAAISFGTIVVKAHAQWMDRVKNVVEFQRIIEEKWIPQTLKNKEDIAVISKSVELILRSQERIEKKLDTHPFCREGK